MNIICLGDSLMQQNNALTFPQAGWPEGLSDYILELDKVHVLNFALNGRSTKSFIAEGQFAKSLEAASKGDIVFISFGHNDEKIQDKTRFTDPNGSYKQNLITMAEAFASKGCEVVFLSSIARLVYGENHSLAFTHGLYPKAMEDAARELGVRYIDLAKLSYDYLCEHPHSTDSSFYMICEPGMYPNYMSGITDTSHLNIVGAKWICRLLMPSLKAIPSLAKIFR